MRIVIADDHPILREGLIRTISVEPDFEIVGETGDGKKALELIRDLSPELAVLDISMPGMTGLEIVRKCQQENLQTLFVILTMYKEEEYFNEALDLGVKGYILKENAAADLVACLKYVQSGKHYVSPVISEYLVNRHSRSKELHEDIPTLNKLTQMEKQVLKLISENKTSKEIAVELFISYRTVQNHRNNICQKLGFSGHNKLLQFALENKTLF